MVMVVSFLYVFKFLQQRLKQLYLEFPQNFMGKKEEERRKREEVDKEKGHPSYSCPETAGLPGTHSDTL